MSSNNAGAFIFLCITNKRLKYLLLSNKFIYVILYQYNGNQDKGVFKLKIPVMYIFEPIRYETAGHEKYNSKERVALSHCFIVLLIRRSRKLIYLNEEILPLKRVRINPACNTFVRLVFFLVWFLFQLLL